jgi:cation diffusion facilitator family transporter
MVGELVIGFLTNSMALTADGWHMATHAGALGMSAAAYWYARTRARHGTFTFGTGKLFSLSGYTSAIALGAIALAMLVESIARLASPVPVHFAQALPVAIVGLAVNLLSAKLLYVTERTEIASGHAHGGHGHAHGHGGLSHGDANLRAAYLHVVADALTSLLAIVALLSGRYLGLAFLDPVMGIVGGLVIMRWAAGLGRDCARQLLDTMPSHALALAIRQGLEELDDVKVADLHLWEIAPGRQGCIISLLTSVPRDTEDYRRVILNVIPQSHLTVEVRRCPDPARH